MQITRISTFLLLCLLLGACVNDIIELPEDQDGRRYFPLEIGKYIEYSIDSVQYDPTGECIFENSLAQYFIREEVSEITIDLAEDTLYRVKVLRKDSIEGSWNFLRFTTIKKTPSELIVTEDNIPLLKLAFPLSENKTWSTSAYADDGTKISVKGESLPLFIGWDRSTIHHINQFYSLGSFNFEKSLYVNHVDYDDKIDYRFYDEIYAEDVGLVYRKIYIMYTQCCGNLADCEGDNWEEKAEEGFYLEQKIIGYN